MNRNDIEFPMSEAPAGRIVTETLHGVGLERTVTDESPDRAVRIYLPPGYDESGRRYPVVYLLHGSGGTGREYVSKPSRCESVQALLDAGIASGSLQPMILVMPDQNTRRFGSFYVNSSVTGNWEDFTTAELIAFIDRQYRTIAESGGRGIAGHSMGGYGALRLGMRHTDLYSAVYAMSPAAIGWRGDMTPHNRAFIEAFRARTAEEIVNQSFAAGIIRVSQAISPNPRKPPFYVDLPYAEVDGRAVPAEPGFSNWQAAFLDRMVPEYREQLRTLRALRFDAGRHDEFTHIPMNCRALSEALTAHAVEHIFEEYNGAHRDRLWGRHGRIGQELLPFFSRHLDRDASQSR